MREILLELYGHQAWADAEHWNAFESIPEVLKDKEICERLYHIHLVQHAFILIVQGQRPAVKRFEDLPDMKALREYGQNNQQSAMEFLEKVTEERLKETIRIPWFKEPPLKITVGRALIQAVMHSQHHRAQNAMRFRELGGIPPTTDFIAWHWKGQPKPAPV
jgi:uncharacterized damage-inducible protein DinB